MTETTQPEGCSRCAHPEWFFDNVPADISGRKTVLCQEHQIAVLAAALSNMIIERTPTSAREAVLVLGECGLQIFADPKAMNLRVSPPRFDG